METHGTPFDHENDLTDLERRLAAWRPAPGSLDRDRMLFEAGRAGVQIVDRTRFWRLATAASTLVAVTLGGLLAARALATASASIFQPPLGSLHQFKGNPRHKKRCRLQLLKCPGQTATWPCPYESPVAAETFRRSISSSRTGQAGPRRPRRNRRRRSNRCGPATSSVFSNSDEPACDIDSMIQREFS